MSEDKEKSVDVEEKNSKKNEVDPQKVHSANSWESVDMGDDDRKKKFLRLMGASKKEHSGRFVIGDQEAAQKHARGKEDTDKVNRELEDQYRHSTEHKVTRYSHKGLGFENKPDTDSQNDQSKPTDSDNRDKSNENVQSDRNRESGDADRKRESGEPADSTGSSPPKRPKMMMNFVKASD